MFYLESMCVAKGRVDYDMYCFSRIHKCSQEGKVDHDVFLESICVFMGRVD